MKQKRIYVSPTIEVVKMVSGSALLDTSATTIREAYEFQDNTGSNGWQ